MPSAILISQSGGVGLISGNIFSGTPWPLGGVQLQYNASGPGPIYVGLPSPISATGAVTIKSGGGLSSGGLADGVEIYPGQPYFVSKARLVSGIETIRVGVPAASSGARVDWEYF
ncbi:hypothetical protein C4577_03665 [Candidatus Parcubacteria bacterium]|nr:MAG: hypothetical protein C4577_03665 [Candidatus Parcubacteria bacterium]